MTGHHKPSPAIVSFIPYFYMFGERFRRKMRDSIQFSKRLKGEPIVDLGLLDAVNNGEISLDRINESVKGIVRAKLLHLM